MSEDRLKELLRQRALLAEHLAWLDREIAATRAPGSPPPASAANEPARVVPAIAAGLRSAPQPADPGPAADVDTLFDRFQSEEKSRGQVSKQGCWLVFAALMLVSLAGISALIFARYR